MEKVLFNDFNISEEVKRAVAEVGFTEPTPIQAQSIPLILEGNDVIGRSHTGTGKTAAFGIPAIECIDTELNAVQVLALCPTRELAMQAAEEVEKFAKYKRGIKVAAVYGGASIDRQILQLKKGANIVIGTPGRIMDHMRRRTLKLKDVKMVILDEADEMLNMGFRDDIETILTQVPEERQTILFSATMPKAIMDITKLYQNNPTLVAIGNAESQTAAKIEQYFFECPMGRKMDVLNLLLNMYEPRLSIVFCNTKKMVDELADYLNASGFKAVGIHGDMKQSARTQVMNSFKSHRTRILIATDVAARGIDVENVDAVFNFDIPQDNEYYVHRIGRTARAGKEGKAYTLISGRKQFFQLRDIMSSTGAKIVKQEIPSADSILVHKREAFISKIADNVGAEPRADVPEIISALIERGHTEAEIATAAVSMLYSKQKLNLPQVVSTGFDRGERPVGKVGKLSGIVLGIGRQQRIAPNFILGAIADATGLSGKSVGKIDIYDDYTVVQMSDENASRAVDTMESTKINGFKTTVRLITGKDKFAPSFGRRDDRRSDDRRGGYKPRGDKWRGDFRSRDGKDAKSGGYRKKF